LLSPEDSRFGTLRKLKMCREVQDCGGKSSDPGTQDQSTFPRESLSNGANANRKFGTKPTGTQFRLNYEHSRQTHGGIALSLWPGGFHPV
jgi:hypothetical protein